ncbi:MAG TPA: tRNA (guanosine(46)-N7)-methyltransferase TrmB [Candidatus Saccharimonadales bacterium]|jgi:tRNA (guanine-N7-)-methyltransferase|nr:tRNA (guanosine(46)-N7)-methyltransferase TrmB [Candidatus Saccharimonadales bacterium]
MALNPDDFIITHKRKKYRFAKFSQYDNCFEADNWQLPTDHPPLTLEVGAGTALFSVELARRYPDRLFVATDVKADRLQKGAGEAEASALTNVNFVRIHAAHLAELLPLGSVSELWITFPDPCPKNRTAKHRLTHLDFLRLYRKLLQPQAQLYFKTDNQPLFCWSLEQLVADNWHLTQLSFDLHATDMSDDYKIMTTYEQKFQLEGLATHFVAARPLKNSV